jgi:hypothetical protein
LVTREGNRSRAPRRPVLVNRRLVLGLLLVVTACGTSHAHPSAGFTTTRVRSVASTSTSTPTKLRTCMARDLHASADWVAGFYPTGGSGVDTRTGGLEMTGQLRVWNVSSSSCVLPERFTVRVVGSHGGELALRSEERNFGLSGYNSDGPLAPGALAAAPIDWVPSWCGTDPGLTPVLAVTLASPDAPLRMRVSVLHPEFPHVPSCIQGVAASVLVVAPFRQTGAG